MSWASTTGVVEHHEAAHVVAAHALGYRVRGVWCGYSGGLGETDVQVGDPLRFGMILLAGERGETFAPSWYPELGHEGSGPDRALMRRHGVQATKGLIAEVDAILLDNLQRLHRLAARLEARRRLDEAELAAILGRR